MSRRSELSQKLAGFDLWWSRTWVRRRSWSWSHWPVSHHLRIEMLLIKQPDMPEYPALRPWSKVWPPQTRWSTRSHLNRRI